MERHRCSDHRDRDPAAEAPRVLDAVPGEEPEEQLREAAELRRRDAAADDDAARGLHAQAMAALLRGLRLGRLARPLLQELIVLAHLCLRRSASYVISSALPAAPGD